MSKKKNIRRFSAEYVVSDQTVTDFVILLYYTVQSILNECSGLNTPYTEIVFTSHFISEM